MKSSTDVPDYLAVARIREVVESEFLWICTARGSALDELEPPFEGRLFFPSRGGKGSEPGSTPPEPPEEGKRSEASRSPVMPGSFDDLLPSFVGPGVGRYFPITITELRRRRHDYALRVQLHQVVDPAGGWVCIHRSLLEKKGGLYFYQIQNLPVRRQPGGEILGSVGDYFETGSNGILIVNRGENPDVYLPLHPDFVTIDLEGGEVLVPGFDDFL